MEDRVVIRKGSFGSWTVGLIVGSLVGGTIALLMAPQSGMQTRAQLSQTSGQVRDKAMGMMEDARNRVTDVAGQAKDRVSQVMSNMSSGSTSKSDQLESDFNRLNREANILESDMNKSYDV